MTQMTFLFDGSLTHLKGTGTYFKNILITSAVVLLIGVSLLGESATSDWYMTLKVLEDFVQTGVFKLL